MLHIQRYLLLVVITMAGLSAVSSPAAVCTYALGSGGQGFLAGGGNGSINIIAPNGCVWTASNPPTWVIFNSSNFGVGNGAINFQVVQNTSANRSATISIHGLDFTIEQASGTISGIANAGSMAQIAAAGGWKTTITLINTGSTVATARLNFFGNNGSPQAMPLFFPQLPPAAGPVMASTLDRSLSPGASVVIEATGPDAQPLLSGWAQLQAAGSVGGFAIFTETASNQEAVVPLETRSADSYILPFDNTGGVATGLALANVGPQSTGVPLLIRDDAGTVIANQMLNLDLQQHTSFLLGPTYAATAGMRGTVEFSTTPGARISVLGLRADGAALTTLPTLANVTASGGSIAHVASAGGWKTIFTLVNTDTIVAPATLSFFDNNGKALGLPLHFPQTGGAQTSSALTRTMGPGDVLIIETAGLDTQAVASGSARLTTAAKISGFAIFRYNPTGQQAVVPLETRKGSSYILAFDNTNGVATGLALANISSQAAAVSVVLRDDHGTVLGTPTINLPAGGHASFLLTDNYAATAGKRGTVEFDTAIAGQISALGLRATPSGTLTTIPVLAK